jgi:hypothetical protein
MKHQRIFQDPQKAITDAAWLTQRAEEDHALVITNRGFVVIPTEELKGDELIAEIFNYEAETIRCSHYDFDD